MILHIDVISDVISPWCFIGKRRLEKAVANLDRQHEVRLRWLPFQLNPQMPKEGISRRDYRIKKFGSWERSQELDAKMVAVGPTTIWRRSMISFSGFSRCQSRAS